MKNENFVVEVNCPPNISSLTFLRKLTREALQYSQMEEQSQICFAINEGLINAVHYSNKKDMITFSIKKKEDFLEFTIINHGGELSKKVFEKVATQTLDDVLWDEEGRGFLIINQVADDWSITRDEQGRNILKIRLGVKVLEC